MTSGNLKWHEKRTLFRPTFRSGTEFTIPDVSQPLVYLNSFRPTEKHTRVGLYIQHST